MRASSKASKKNLSAAVRVSRSPLELARARCRRATTSRKIPDDVRENSREDPGTCDQAVRVESRTSPDGRGAAETVEKIGFLPLVDRL